MKSIKLNDRGPEVTKIQLLLNSLLTPRPNLRVDGHFGARTYQAVVAFQRAKGLAPDGEVGPKTRTALGLKVASMPIMTAITPSAPWMAIAIAELGVHVDSLPGQHNARILEYHQTTTLRATDEKQFKALERSLHLVIPSVTGIDVAPNNIGEVELKIREGERAGPARVVSEGTLRILGFRLFKDF